MNSQQTTRQPCIAERFAPLGTTIFAKMTALAQKHNAVNLSQGFPDFDGPDFVKAAAIDAINSGSNQYARSFGEPVLTDALATMWQSCTGQSIDPNTQLTVTSGCTEALAATFLGLINPGDEVIMFEPFYDSYRACVAMAGATARFVTLTPAEVGHGEAHFVFDETALRNAFKSEKIKAILVNTPHNPTGKVFTKAELELIAQLCIEHDVIAITDEVYEHLVYDENLPHLRLATFPGMAERTVTLSSLGKSFSLTGWKLGWSIASPELTAGVRSAHQFLTYASATPLEHAAAVAITQGSSYIMQLVAQYRDARRFLCNALREIGFGVIEPAGTYFIMADHTPFGFEDDVAFCQHLTEHVGVAAIPPGAFYADASQGKSLVRFCFCKQQATLDEAVRRMQAGLKV